jgi:N-acyl-D-amino-acid deacylase
MRIANMKWYYYAGVSMLLAAGAAALPSYAPQLQASGNPLPSLTLLLAPQQAQATQPKGDLPVNGKAGPGLEPLDKAMKTIMLRHGIPGGALAIAKDGKLVFAKGYGWANLDTGETVNPLTLFGLASLSKPITALAILLLMEQGKLGLDEPAFDYIKHIKPPKGAQVDPRLHKITIRQLLNHSGGWNRLISGDPIGWTPQMCQVLGANPPLAPEHFVSFMMGVPLDFEPGTQAYYSNVGYIILGLVVEKVSGQNYEDYVKKHVLEAVGAKRAGMNYMTKYLDGESRRYLAGTATMLPPLQLPMVRAAAGWSASPVDLCRLLTALDGSRGQPLLQEKTLKLLLAMPPPPLKANPNGTHPGLGFPEVITGPDGFSYSQDGNWHGMRAFMKRTFKGVNWVMTFNASMQPDQVDTKVGHAALEEIHETLARTGEFPNLDLFKEYP